MKYDASELLGTSNKGFLHRIDPTKEQRAFLVNAQTEVRKRLKEAFESLSSFAATQDRENLDNIYLDSASESIYASLVALNEAQLRDLIRVTPKFKTQGSYSYNTMNQPCQPPKQQIDLDDGVYLPVNMVEDSPILRKDLFFQIVDNCLDKLAYDMGWEFSSKKDTCSRIILNNPDGTPANMHLDIPLYAIPRQRYEEMRTERLKAYASRKLDDGVQLSEASALESLYTQDEKEQEELIRLLKSDEVFLALRNEEHWMVSDPAKISDWFKHQVEIHKEPLRQVSRLLKAWRDHSFDEGGPSSVSLMVCAVETACKKLNEQNHQIPLTLSEMLLNAATALPSQLAAGVENPTDKDEKPMYPRKDMDVIEQKRIMNAALDLAKHVKLAIVDAQNEQESVNYLRKVFGHRLPNSPELIGVPNYSDIARTTPVSQEPQVIADDMHSS